MCCLDSLISVPQQGCLVGTLRDSLDDGDQKRPGGVGFTGFLPLIRGPHPGKPQIHCMHLGEKTLTGEHFSLVGTGDMRGVTAFTSPT
jgi:hypothetical protein